MVTYNSRLFIILVFLILVGAYVIFIGLQPGGFKADACIDMGGGYNYETGECVEK